MMNPIELAKKLKKLSDSGIGGEKDNAESMLNALLKKHNLTIGDIEGERIEDHFFRIKKEDVDLFMQIVKRVDYSIKIYGELPPSKIKKFGLGGNYFIESTASVFIEIATMLDHYSALYKNELDIFFGAFLTANDLLVTIPNKKTTSDLTPEQLEVWLRQQQMASGIKTETFRKRIDKTYN